MLAPEFPINLPSTEDLPCSDDTPVDNEDQNLLPNLLLFVLASIWSARMDWYFGVDMAQTDEISIKKRSTHYPTQPDGTINSTLRLAIYHRSTLRQGDTSGLI